MRFGFQNVGRFRRVLRCRVAVALDDCRQLAPPTAARLVTLNNGHHSDSLHASPFPRSTCSIFGIALHLHIALHSLQLVTTLYPLVPGALLSFACDVMI